MFTGQFTNSIDAKGRVSIPSAFRQTLVQKNFNSFILANHFDGCINAYTPDGWKEIVEKVNNLPQSKPEVKAYQRFVISSALECPLDKQGRLLIPQTQREHAKIQKEVVFAGVGERIEIWGKEVWDKIIEESKEILINTETLAELGL